MKRLSSISSSKAFFLKLGAFLAVILSLQMAYTRGVHEFSEVKNISDLLSQKTDVLWFGDSVMTSAGVEADTRPVPYVLRDFLPGNTIGMVSMGAYHSLLFLEIVKYIKKQPIHFRPKVLIFEINPRSFSVEMDRRPEYQFEKNRLLLQYGDSFWLHHFFHPLLTFNAFNLSTVSPAEFYYSPVYNGETQVGVAREFLEAENSKNPKDFIKNRYLLHYMYGLKPDHRKLVAYQEIASELKGTGIQPVFYVTPIDYQLGESYWGPGFSIQVKKNIETIRSALAAEGSELIDMTFDLRRELFTHPDIPNEHLNQEGRRHLARRVADYIKAKRMR